MGVLGKTLEFLKIIIGIDYHTIKMNRTGQRSLKLFLSKFWNKKYKTNWFAAKPKNLLKLSACQVLPKESSEVQKNYIGFCQKFGIHFCFIFLKLQQSIVF
jgi:hypothetical protein